MGRTAARLLVFVAVPPTCHGFVLTTGGYRWAVPAALSSSEGLGGGLSFVVSDSLCSSLLGKFRERDLLYGVQVSALQFVHCSDLLNALQRGLSTWSENHRLLSFSDIAATPACADSASRSGALSDLCPWEMFIGTDDGVAYPKLAAYVLNHRTSSVAGVGPNHYSVGVRSASGVVAAGDAHARSVMRLQTHLCWYLDATFCYYFQMWHAEHGIDVLLIVRLVCLGLFSLAAMRLAFIVFWALLACVVGKRDRLPLLQHSEKPGRTPGCCQQACTACLNYLSTLSPGGNVLLVFLLICPPIFYERIFLPCWECYDFEAVVAHEVGHVLGFGHPDDKPEANLAAKCAMTNATCRDSFGLCASPSAYVEGGSGGDRSIMHSMTQRASRTCLSPEDLNGLHLLYPLCDGSQPTSVACTKGRILSGWLRLAIVVGVPVLFAVLFVLLPLTCLRWRDQRRMKRLDKQLGLARNEIVLYREKLEEAEAAILRGLKDKAKAALQGPSQALRESAATPGTALHRLSRFSEAVQNTSGRFGAKLAAARKPGQVVPVRAQSFTLRDSTEAGEPLARVVPPELRPAPRKSRAKKPAKRPDVPAATAPPAPTMTQATPVRPPQQPPQPQPMQAPRPAYAPPVQPGQRGGPTAAASRPAAAALDVERQWERADEDLDGFWRDAERQVQGMAGGKGLRPGVGVGPGRDV